MKRLSPLFTAKLPEPLRLIVLHRIWGILLPVMLVLIVPVILQTLILAPAEPLRLVPTLTGAALLPICYFLYRRRRVKAVSIIMLVAVALVIFLAMTVSGGLHAPGFLGAIPFIIIFTSVYGNRIGGVAFIIATLISLGFAFAEMQGWIVAPLEPHPLFRFGIHFVWFVFALIATMVQTAMLSETLSQSENERRNAEDARRRAEAAHQQFFQQISLLSSDGIVFSANQSSLDFMGAQKEDVAGRHLADLPVWAEEQSRLKKSIQRAAAGQRDTFETVLVNRDGNRRHIDFTIGPFYDDNKELAYLIAEGRDVTDLVRVRETLAQREKMDSLGELAGGIAHDFNNMLSGIIGTAEVLRLDGPGNREQFNRSIDTLLKAAERASSLTGNLLVFSRRKSGNREIVSVHRIVEETIELLRRTIDKRIVIASHLNASCDFVEMDVAQMQNVLINLGVNARDAMPGGGTITISSENLTLSPESAQRLPIELSPGEYLHINFHDTGTGMTDEIQRHIFEPFFTTKGEAQGTGVGLATVYGTMLAHKGLIEVQSQMNKGTAFELLLPLSELAPGQRESIPDNGVKDGDGCVLVVDDEEVVLEASEMMLRSLGYSVLKTSDGQQAIDWYTAQPDTILFVLLDMMMPHMDGAEVFYHLKAVNPNVKVILATGFAPGDAVQQMLADGLVDVLEKPYLRRDLKQMIQKAGISEATVE